MATEPIEPAATPNEMTVARRVLGTFTDTVAEETGLAPVATRLKTAIEQGDLSETALKKALFGENSA